jgi:hypothetical protein
MGDLGLLDSLVSQQADGALVVGRGVPNSWLASGRPIAVSNFAAADGRRIGVTISGHGKEITLSVTGNTPGPVIFDLPAFAGTIAAASSGTVSASAGTVTIPAGTRSVTVTLDRAP